MRKLLAALAAVALSATVAAAVPQLKFDDPTTPGGLLSYDGAGGAIVGTKVLFQSIQGIDTPLNAGVTLQCVGCTLDFLTGAVTSEGPSTWTAGTGGILAITGAVPALGLAAGTTLVGGGSFSGANPSLTASGTTGIFTGFGTDSKNAELAKFYGLSPTGFTFASTEIALGTFLENPMTHAFTATPTNSDFNNQSRVANPAALLLLGAGMGVAALVRRRRA